MNLISKNGYSIPKEKLTLVEAEKLKSDLTVKARVSFNNGVPPESFKIYKESINSHDSKCIMFWF